MLFVIFSHKLFIRYFFIFSAVFLFYVFPLSARYQLFHKNFIPIRLGVNFSTILYENKLIQTNHITRFHTSIGYERILHNLGRSGVISFGLDTFYVGRGSGTIDISSLASTVTTHALSFPMSLRYGLTDFRSFFPYVYVGFAPTFNLGHSIDGNPGDVFNFGEHAFPIFDITFKVGIGIFWNKVMLEFSYEIGLLDASNEYIVSDYDHYSLFYLSFGSRIGFDL